MPFTKREVDEDKYMLKMFSMGDVRCKRACELYPEHWRCHIPYPPMCDEKYDPIW